jgi:hypothetical protein
MFDIEDVGIPRYTTRTTTRSDTRRTREDGSTSVNRARYKSSERREIKGVCQTTR